MDRIRTAEIVAALSLATDMAMGLPFEHGLRSTLYAMRLGRRLGLDDKALAQAYYVNLLYYIGCTSDVDIVARAWGDEQEVRGQIAPVVFGSPAAMMRGMLTAAHGDLHGWERLVAVIRAAPVVVREMPEIGRGHCEVAAMLAERLGLDDGIRGLFAFSYERWDGKGMPDRVGQTQIPLPVRLAHITRDADIQLRFGGTGGLAEVLRRRSGRAFDPALVTALLDDLDEVLALPPGESAWDAVLDAEPSGAIAMLEGPGIDRALGAIAAFCDVASPYLRTHSSGVATLAAAAAAQCGSPADEVIAVRRAGLIHDVGRVATPVGVWQRPGPLGPDDWEKVRLHAYHTDRVFARSPFLAGLAAVASAHHERLDGSGYHRGIRSSTLPSAARILAAADAYHAMCEDRPHRPAFPAAQAAESLRADVRAGRLDGHAVDAVLQAAGHGRRSRAAQWPAALTDREVDVLRLLARGRATKQIAHTLGISPKTADNHIQRIYAKAGVSTRAAATLFAMEHALLGDSPAS